jgi:hypothetical protein
MHHGDRDLAMHDGRRNEVNVIPAVYLCGTALGANARFCRCPAVSRA